MSKNNIYDLTIIVMMYFVFTFDLPEMESIIKKYKLVYCPTQKSLFLDHLILCLLYKSSKKGKIVEAKRAEKRDLKSFLIISFPHLYPDVHAIENFCIALVEPLESWFIASLDLSNINHICHHDCTIILIRKEFSFSPDHYH